MSDNGEVKVARTAGFCWGVKRAIDIAMNTAKNTDGPVYTHGPLIHNPQAIEMLEGKEIFALKDASTLEKGTVIIRTHGVTPEVRRGLKERGLTINDATCPLVAKVQGIIKKHAHKGYHTIIIGDAGHAEVTGLMGYADGRSHVIGAAEDVDALPPMDKVCVVAQTTCDIQKYGVIVDAIKLKYPEAVVAHTICDATEERQEEVLKLAREVDAMIVVGGRNSANTGRLAQIAGEAGAETFLVETEEELDPAAIVRFARVGITAGASTPAWMIERVKERVEHLRGRKRAGFGAKIKAAAELAVVSNISLAAGAALMTYANCTLTNTDFGWRAGAIPAMYLFSMYVLNQINDMQSYKNNEPEKMRFYLKRSGPMNMAALLSAAGGFALAASLGMQAGGVYVVAMILGLGYTVKWFPKWKVIRIHRLKDIPASKDVFVGLGWGAVTVLIPALGQQGEENPNLLAIAFIFTFTLVYIRSVLSDIRDINGDRLVGRETIPILIGNEGTKVFLALIVVGLATMLVSAAMSGLAGPFAYVLLLSIAYTALYLWFYHKRIISRGLRFDLTLDGVFYFTGALAIIWTAAA
ncbi:MAG: 4-hydroxy-3-methylbut-2-enyl diphosphate reductase [Nitrospinae bacterium]|nr:4-hydroxy-3-methylbut-2-enyl diphosphate reductase [Nitrospinota bacterium]